VTLYIFYRSVCGFITLIGIPKQALKLDEQPFTATCCSLGDDLEERGVTQVFPRGIFDMEISDGHLAAEVDRALRETTEALGALALERRLPVPLMSLHTLIGKIEVSVIAQPGESSFELVSDEIGTAVMFRVGVLRKIFNEVADLGAEIGDLDADELRRAQQIAINLFIIHELMHIRQNFPDFASVAGVKAGFPGFGLSVLDLTADIISAWVCAHVEAHRLQDGEQDGVEARFVTTLTLSYVIGCLIFDGRTDPTKRQRMLGIVVSAVLAQAKVTGTLRQERILASWSPTSPVLVINIERFRVFNALVVDAMSGLLVDMDVAQSEAANEFWESVGQRPVYRTFALAAELLRKAGAIQ
jgi:hypothetical protein